MVTSADSRRLNREYQDKMFDLVAGRCLRKLFLPAPLDAAYTAFRSIRFLWKGVRCVLSRRLEVEVLDALSIGVSLLRGDFGTAGSVMFLLNLGSLLEEWTRKKSLDDLARIGPDGLAGCCLYRHHRHGPVFYGFCHGYQ